MTFHCDRCKTRYTIADERVRGKVLKIRCKNCASVITVRGRAASEAEEPQGAAKAGGPPPWFLSVGGIQHGPMSLAEAMAWVAQREPTELIYGWTEGFEAWRSVDELDDFADLREPPSPGEEPNFEGDTVIAPPSYKDELDPGEGVTPADAAGEADPKAASQAEPESTEASEPADPAQPGDSSPAGASSEGLSSEGPSPAGLSIDPGDPAPRIGRGRSALPIVLAVAALAALAGVASVFLLGAEDEPPPAPPPDAAPPPPPDAGPQGPLVLLEPREPVEEAAVEADAGADAPMADADVLAAYEEYGFLLTRCYTRALEDDPELAVEAADLELEIEPSGRVAEVAIPELEDTELGECVASRIRGWQLRESSEGLSGEFRLRFIP